MTTHITQLQIKAFVIASLFFFFAFSNVSEAYFTTNQTAQKIGNSILFTIEYTFGTGSYDMELPILTKRQTVLQNDYLSFEIYDDADPEENDVVPGSAVGLVLSSAEVSDTATYHINKNEREKMIFVVLFTPDTPVSGNKYSLQVEALPFKIGGTQNKLNKPELRPYTTELISW